ncbi:MAG: DNA sulfur modification protein DndB [Pyrinomonadaceae bacterium]
MSDISENSEFDPTVAASLEQELKNCSVGKSPSGFPKIHVEMLPGDLVKLVAYDPRSIPPSPRPGQQDPHHVSEDLVDLVREVQRTIDPQKVDEMVNYLEDALSNGKYADWAELDVVTAAKPDMSRWTDKHCVYIPSSAEYFITDGQHRFCALMDFARKYPNHAGRFTQAVSISVLPHDRLREWAGQSFHDKNYLRTPVKVTKALAVDSRDLHNILAKELRDHPVIKDGGGINEVKDSLAATAKEFATHSVMYRFTRGFCEGQRGLNKGPIKGPKLTPDSYNELKDQLFEYMSELNEVFPHWTVVPGREEYLFRASAALQALGVIGQLLFTKVPESIDRKAMINGIGEAKLDWRRTNVKDWGSVIGGIVEKKDEAGNLIAREISPRSNRQAFDGTIKFLRDRSGLTDYINKLAGREEIVTA